ncbi:MAG: hypothetical protein JSR60_19445 [Proteobacteria bacterium]|nr:hypothetical protein [Pseudomonadota bacterium]
MKIKLSIAALLLAGTAPFAAQAAGIQANLSTSYTNITNSGGGDLWNIDGALGSSLGGSWGAEVTGGYHNSSGTSSGNFGGAISWSGSDYRLAASGNYLNLGGFSIANYGVGGEWFASSQWTLGIRGGGVDGTGSSSGGYVGGEVKFYATPNIVLNGGVDYIDISGASITSEDISAEWLVSQTTPISIFGGYQHTDAGGANLDAFFVGLRIYTNDPAGSALVDRQRGGNLGYLDGMPYLGKIL